jgi:hypothetical protein
MSNQLENEQLFEVKEEKKLEEKRREKCKLK